MDAQVSAQDDSGMPYYDSDEREDRQRGTIAADVDGFTILRRACRLE